MIQTTMKLTHVRIMDMEFKYWGKPKIYLFSPTLGSFSIINDEIPKFHSIDEEVSVWYKINYTDDKEFLQYDIQSIHTKEGKWSIGKATFHK